MDKFSIAEMKGRSIFNKKLIKNNSTEIKFTPSKYDKVDVFWSKNDKKYVGEIKYRNYDSNVKFIENEGLLIEKIKYDELKRLQAESGMTSFYINIMQDGKIFLFDLTDNKCPQWRLEKDKYPKDSQYNKDKKVDKLVAYLPIEDAIVCRYNNKESQ